MLTDCDDVTRKILHCLSGIINLYGIYLQVSLAEAHIYTLPLNIFNLKSTLLDLCKYSNKKKHIFGKY